MCRAMRQQSGATDASAQPSQREARQAVVDQLSKPQDLREPRRRVGTVEEKEVFAKAYNTMLMYQLISSAS